MAGIYIHIPFCKQACNYCNFHFTTSLKYKTDLIKSIVKEIEIKSEDNSEIIETIYFGGGTPSILVIEEVNLVLETIFKNYKIANDAEITFECNPDDIDEFKLKKLLDIGINRLSIGVQSFENSELKMMNRAHNSKTAVKSIEISKKYFDNISIDLMYGLPKTNLNTWNSNLKIALDAELKHITTYAITVEPKTLLKKQLETGVYSSPDEQIVFDQYKLTNSVLRKKKYINYELSSYALEGFFSRNNKGYWLGKKYIGIGPSAHSFDGAIRSWNISNNRLYIKAIDENKNFFEFERLTKIDKFNEYIMTGLRTLWGVSLNYIMKNFGEEYKRHFIIKSKKYLDQDYLKLNNGVITSSIEGKFLSDGIASELFILNQLDLDLNKSVK